MRGIQKPSDRRLIKIWIWDHVPEVRSKVRHVVPRLLTAPNDDQSSTFCLVTSHLGVGSCFNSCDDASDTALL